MRSEPAARDAVYAVLGDPVAHSLSPAIHNAAFLAADRRARYVARRVSSAECGEVMRTLALDGGGGNVTVPHKERVVPFLDRCSRAVAATGACNTFWARDGEVWGDNTDVEGFSGVWRREVRALGSTSPVLVVGAREPRARFSTVWCVRPQPGPCTFCCGIARPAAHAGWRTKWATIGYAWRMTGAARPPLWLSTRHRWGSADADARSIWERWQRVRAW